jgi:hypothetical protein
VFQKVSEDHTKAQRLYATALICRGVWRFGEASIGKNLVQFIPERTVVVTVNRESNDRSHG